MIPASAVRSPVPVTATRKAPEPLTVPAITLSPGRFVTRSSALARSPERKRQTPVRRARDWVFPAVPFMEWLEFLADGCQIEF